MYLSEKASSSQQQTGCNCTMKSHHHKREEVAVRLLALRTPEFIAVFSCVD